MKEIKIINYDVEEMKNAGCDNGNYPAWKGNLEDGTPINGITCRCGKGCSNTDHVVYDMEGMEIYLVIEQ